MTGFIKLANAIFDYSLTPKALFVYAYLLSKINCLQTTVCTYATVSAACNMDAKTVQSAIVELESKKLLTKQNRFNTRGYLANRYYMTNIIQDNRHWFRVDKQVFSTSIKATDFTVYCFICRALSQQGEAFPSLTAICTGTGISRGRVAQSISYLRAYTFLNHLKRHYRRTRAYRHNRYLPFQCNLKKGKRKARTSQVRTQQILPTYIVHPITKKCKHFFYCRGSTQFPKQVLDPQVLLIKKKFYRILL